VPAGGARREVNSNDVVELDARASLDPDGNRLSCEWVYYPEPGTYRGEAVRIEDARSRTARFTAPKVDRPQTIHLILMVSDDGSPPLARYRRVVVTVRP
jgi:hypothetical protein